MLNCFLEENENFNIFIYLENLRFYVNDYSEIKKKIDIWAEYLEVNDAIFKWLINSDIL